MGVSSVTCTTFLSSQPETGELSLPALIALSTCSEGEGGSRYKGTASQQGEATAWRSNSGVAVRPSSCYMALSTCNG